MSNNMLNRLLAKSRPTENDTHEVGCSMFKEALQCAMIIAKCTFKDKKELTDEKRDWMAEWDSLLVHTHPTDPLASCWSFQKWLWHLIAEVCKLGVQVFILELGLNYIYTRPSTPQASSPDHTTMAWVFLLVSFLPHHCGHDGKYRDFQNSDWQATESTAQAPLAAILLLACQVHTIWA